MAYGLSEHRVKRASRRAAMRILWVGDTLTPGLAAYPVKLDQALRAVTEYEANQCQNDMRTYAPWTDRTGNARQGLFARSGKDQGKHFIVLYHTMPYGIWLEVKNDGEYAIILPTIQDRGPRVMAHVREVMKAMAA